MYRERGGGGTGSVGKEGGRGGRSGWMWAILSIRTITNVATCTCVYIPLDKQNSKNNKTLSQDVCALTLKVRLY